MGYVVNFADNELVTAEYLNETAAELGGGVLAFQDDMLYGVDDLNGISAELITKGVTRGCGLSVSGSSVTIAEGVLYMSDGRRVVIDSEGVTLDYAVGSINYVWFDYDAVTGFVAPRCTASAPAADDYVQLGQITAEGAVSGKPDRAVMKNPFLGLHGSESYTKSLGWNGVTEEALLWEIELSDVGYQHVIIHSPGYASGGGVVNAFCGFVNLSDGTAFSSLSSIMHGSGDNEMGFTYASTSGEVLAAYSVNTSVASLYYSVYLRFELGTDNVLRVYRRAVNSGTGGYSNTSSTQVTITLC